MVQSEVINVSKLDLTFETNDGPIHALKNVDLKIDKGEFVSFIGPSGCGKTTMLNIVSGLVRPSAGSILFDDKDISPFTFFPAENGFTGITL